MGHYTPARAVAPVLNPGARLYAVPQVVRWSSQSAQSAFSHEGMSKTTSVQSQRDQGRERASAAG